MNWRPTHPRDAPRWISGSTQVITAGLLLTIALVFAQTASQLIDFHFFGLRLKVLDSDHHRSVFGAISLLAQGFAAGAIGVRATSRRSPAGLLAAALVGALTVPRALKSYEPVFQRYDVPILVVPLTVVLVVLRTLTSGDARRVRFILWASLALLACSFALHAVGPQADGASSSMHPDWTWTYQLTGMFKHGAELAGWMLLATGMVAGASPRRGVDPLTVGDIAALLRLSRRKVRKWIDSGFLPRNRIGRRFTIKRGVADPVVDANYTGNKRGSERLWSGKVPEPDVQSD